MNNKTISLEWQGLLAGLIAAASVLGLSFGLAALARPAAPVPAPTPGGSPSSVSRPLAAQVVQGHAFYTQSCAVCHGPGGRGGDGPRLIGLGLRDAQIAATVRDGVKGEMPAFGKKYQTAQVRAIVAYLRSLPK